MTTLDRTIAANERIATNTTSVVAGEVDNNGGKQIVFTFRNDWGASVICHRGSYGGRDGLWELAVLDIDGNLRYDSGITGDVLGYLTPAEVVETLEKIVALPQMTTSDNYVPHAERLALVATSVTLNGNRAKVSGASNDFATVTDLTSGLSCEWAWPTVRRIVSKGGAFKS